MRVRDALCVPEMPVHGRNVCARQRCLRVPNMPVHGRDSEQEEKEEEERRRMVLIMKIAWIIKDDSWIPRADAYICPSLDNVLRSQPMSNAITRLFNGWLHK